MMNQFVTVGRMVNNPEIKDLENGNKVSSIVLAVQRPYKNAEGEYDTDFLDITIWNGIAKSTCDYCKKGDLVGVKGRIQNNNYEVDGKTMHKNEMIAEKITFLSSNKEKTQESDNDLDM